MESDMTTRGLPMPSDLVAQLAQEIRRVDGDHTLGAAALAEALAPFVESALSAGAEPVEYQFQDADGRWCSFHSDKHRIDTIADGRWPIRALYTRPRPATPASGWMPIESAPRDGTCVIGFWMGIRGALGVVDGTNYGITAFNPDSGEWYDASEADNEDDEWARPDFWQPLPAPPASTGTDKQTAAKQAALERV